MKTRDRIYEYAKQNFNEVMHTTINPEGPGVVRIHLIPPKYSKDEVGASVAIVNGQDIVPVNTAWAIILTELIKEVNKYAGKPINEAETQSIVDNTVKGVRKVFPLLFKKIIRQDIMRMMVTFKQVAYGEVPDEEIHFMSLADYAQYMQAPHRMDLLVSAMTKDGEYNCNQNCIHCYAAGQELVSEQELSTEQWKEIIDKCKDALIPQITFTGGEPTMREDLFELIDYSRWFVTRLNTNGIKLSEDYCKKLSEVSLDSCQITFYSYDEKIHNTLVGKEQYQNTVAGIKNALNAGLNVSVNTPLCSLNKDYVGTLKFLKELGITYVTCSGLILTGNACKDRSEALQLSSEELKNVLTDAVKYCADNEMEISFTSPGWLEDSVFEELSINKPACGACLSNMAITPGGNVVPCQSYLSAKPLGNMLTDNFSSIWESEKCISHRAFSTKMNGECPLRNKTLAEKEVTSNE